MKTRRRLALAALVPLVFLAACGSDDDTASTDTAPADTATADTQQPTRRRTTRRHRPIRQQRAPPRRIQWRGMAVP